MFNIDNMVISTAMGQAIYHRVRAGYIRRGGGVGQGGRGEGGIAFILSTWRSKINKPWDRGWMTSYSLLGI